MTVPPPDKPRGRPTDRTAPHKISTTTTRSDGLRLAQAADVAGDLAAWGAAVEHLHAAGLPAAVAAASRPNLPPAAGPDRYPLTLLPQHAQLLAASAITPEVARARGYVSVDSRKQLQPQVPRPWAADPAAPR